jgi:redox-sensitive bicupin YhaK (pirin superfamily)
MFTGSSIIVSIRNAAITIWITLTTFLKTLTSSQTPFQYSRKEIDLPETMSVARTIVKAFKAIEKAEGAGARVRRSVGTHQLQHFSPFLMLDHFTIGEGAGFPDHPHRFVHSARPLP